MQVHRRVQARVGACDAQRSEQLYKSAAACYAALSARLGEGAAYFYGDRPRSLDAAVFAHLALHLYAPMVDSKLSSMLRKHPNLENFVTKFRSKHLGLGGSKLEPPPLDSEDEATAANAKAKAGGGLSPQDKERRRRAKDFVALGVILTLAFCLFTNVIDVEAEGAEGGDR